MDNITQISLITQGSQAISLIRTLFSLGFKPNQISVFTTDEKRNKCFTEFLDYYKINYLQKIPNVIDKGLVISYSNSHKINIESNATFINFHPGRLPYYKGSLSTIHSMINNEKYVGGTWHYMSNKIDHGNILYKFKIKIQNQDTAFSLNHKIFNESINCLYIVLNKIQSKDIGEVQKNEGKFYYNKFPDLSGLDKDLQKRINYFPPYYTK